MTEYNRILWTVICALQCEYLAEVPEIGHTLVLDVLSLSLWTTPLILLVEHVMHGLAVWALVSAEPVLQRIR